MGNFGRVGLAIGIGAVLLCGSLGSNAAQTREQTKSSGSSGRQENRSGANNQDSQVRLSVTLVQVDVVVTDEKGHQVADLGPEDFEIVEDGRTQHITNFSYIALPGKSRDKAEIRIEKQTPSIPMRLRPEQVRRTIAFVVDDLGLSFENMPNVRAAIRKFVNEQMQPGDMVAILRTGVGVGALQQFTSDRRQLLAAAERLKWNPHSRSGISSIPPISTAPQPSDNSLTEDASGGREDIERLRNDVFAVGTIGTLNLVVRSLRTLPGRKSVILFSDGIVMHTINEPNDRVVQALRNVIDLANRSSVVFYTIDAAGLDTLNFTAADAKRSGGVDWAPIAGRRDQRFVLQEGLNYLARETGGLFTRANSDLSAGIERALDDQQGYYLIGYTPERNALATGPGSQARSRAHRVLVKLKRPGYQVRSRTSFFAPGDGGDRLQRLSPAQQLVTAVTSPFASGDIHVKLTSLFSYDQKEGAFMRSLMHIDARDIAFEQDDGGWRRGSIELIAFTFGDNGQVVDHFGRAYQIRLRPDVYERVMKEGLIYNMNVPIKKPGAYQLRIAVRDVKASKLGTANQFIDVPDLSKHRLTLSGLAVHGTDPTRAASPQPAAATGMREGEVDDPNPESSPASRRFRRGMYLDYGYAIYNARTGGPSGQPRLESQVILLRDGRTVYTGQKTPVSLEAYSDLKGLVGGGRIQLGSVLPPGEYTLQLVVTDLQASPKYRSTSQWIDFEITN